MEKKFVVPLIPDSDSEEELLIDLPPKVIEVLNLKMGDSIRFELNDDNQVMILKND